MYKFFAAVLALLCFFSTSGLAEETPSSANGKTINIFTEEGRHNLWEKTKFNVSETWKSDTYDLYVPFYAWHNRLAYDEKHLKKYNEEAWGIGIGKYRYDEDGDWHALYAMVFKDSNFYAQTMFGYAFQKNWFVNCDPDFRVGAGFTVGLTQRHEYNYIPVPLPLPLVGVEYHRFALQAAYVPGIKNDGNVLFTWLRYRIN